MKAKEYLSGRPGVRYGIWNSMAKQFQFGIDEPTPKEAQAALFRKIGYDSWKLRFEPRALPPKPKPKK